MKDIIPFNRKIFDPNQRITGIGGGSLGGKAQGLAFINEIIAEQLNADDFPQIEVNIPTLIVIRTDIFDAFMKRNNLFNIAYSDAPDDRIAHAFQKADLPFEILGDLKALVNQVHLPLAVRSSSKLEDAMYEPFAGIYATKMTPNNQHDPDSRFRRLVEAIKYIYASTFFKAAKDYMRATSHQIEDEKMAVIIQEVVGQRFGDRYYPHLSGVARSYNFYPMGRSKPENGVVNLALGLGKTIVDGGISWTYSPAFPKVNPPYGSVGEMLKNTQTDFWYVNMGKPPAYDPIKEDEYMAEGNLPQAESDGALKQLVSTVDQHTGRVGIGMGGQGPRILSFAPLLILNDIPLNNLIKSLLAIAEKALETPVEIEFAMTFSDKKVSDRPHRFGFLQVRPMAVSAEDVQLSDEEFKSENLLIASDRVLGNGTVNSIKNIVYVLPDKFESKYTQKIALELERINRKLVVDGDPYLLIGFGRWGSSDPWLGIPVNWGQVSGAKAVVEATLDNMNVELSQGSHFFHNLTSFNASYFSIPFTGTYGINWVWLEDQTVVSETEFVKHVKLPTPLVVKVDGRQGRGIILKC